MFIEKIKSTYKVAEPILLPDIFKLFKKISKPYIYKLLKKAESDGELIKYSRGVYYLPGESCFGFASISADEIVNYKYIKNKNGVCGVYSGLMLLNQFEVTTQVPNTFEIVTNNESSRKRDICLDGSKYTIRRSRFEINKDNFTYYVVLQLFYELGCTLTLNKTSLKIVKEYITENNIQKDKLINLAMSFPAQTLKNLIRSEVLHGTI